MCSIAKHKIDTKNNRPFKEFNNRLPVCLFVEMLKEIVE